MPNPFSGVRFEKELLVLRITSTVSASRFPGEVLALALLLVILSPAWLLSGANARDDMLVSMVSPWLPVAAGLLISVQAGGLDLSVWGVASLAGALSWAMVTRGWPVAAALPVVMIAGALIGLIQAIIVRLTRLPMWLVTLALGLAVAAGARAVAGWLNLSQLPWETLAPFNMQIVRWLLAAALYIVVLLFLLPQYRLLAREATFEPPRWWGGHIVLIASGALAAGGGALWTISESGYVGSLIPEAQPELLIAVLLCGALSLGSHGGRLLSAVLLPVALAVVKMWWMLVWDVGTLAGVLPPNGWQGLVAPVPFSVLVLLGFVLGVIWLCRRYEPRWRWAIGTLGLAGMGIALTGLGAYCWLDGWAEALRYGGLGIWLAGMAGGLFRSLQLRGRVRSGQPVETDV